MFPIPPSSSQTDPTGPGSGYYRVARGGSYYFDASVARVADRYKGLKPAESSDDLGFRVIKKIP